MLTAGAPLFPGIPHRREESYSDKREYQNTYQVHGDLLSGEAKQQSHRPHQERHDPCYSALNEHGSRGCSCAAKLTLDGGYRGNAGSVQQHEHEEHRCSERGKKRGDLRGISAEQQSQCGDHALLSGEAGQQGGGGSPVAEAQRCEYRCDEPAKQSQQAVLRGFHDV